FVLGMEAGENLERQPGLQREVALPADSPAPAALALQQKYVVRIEVRSHSTAGRCVAHHEIVESRMRNEREGSQQRVGCSEMKIDALDEKCPVALGKRLQVAASEWTMGQRPTPALAEHEA